MTNYPYRRNVITSVKDLLDTLDRCLSEEYATFNVDIPAVTGVIRITFTINDFRKITKLLEIAYALGPALPATHKLDIQFVMTGDITEEDFLEWLGMTKEKYSILNVAKTNERVKYFCEKYKLLLG